MGDPSYIDFIMPVMDSMVGTGEITQMFSEQREQLKKALSAPITAFVVMTVRRHHDRGYELEPVVKEYCEAFPKIPGCVGAVWGPCIERKDVEVGIIGWRSLAVSACVAGQIFCSSTWLLTIFARIVTMQ